MVWLQCGVQVRLRCAGGRGRLSQSVSNLAASPCLSPALSRSDSTCSLASSGLSNATITAAEIRTLTNNYQKMLKQATREIKKLNLSQWKLEQEQEKLLTTNVELAEEAKRLLVQQKEWKAERAGLLAANEEFAAEVERLYRAEEAQAREREQLVGELHLAQGAGAPPAALLEPQLAAARAELEAARAEVADLRAEAARAGELEQRISRMQSDVRRSSGEPGSDKQGELRLQNENLSAENFEYAVENVSCCAIQTCIITS